MHRPFATKEVPITILSRTPLSSSMKRQSSSCSRGGAINYQKGTTDIEHLTDVMSTYVKDNGAFNVFDFGEYNSLGANHAVRGPALAKIGGFVVCLLKARSDACITYTDLKNAFSNVFLKFPEAMTQKGKTMQQCAGDMADRCMVILKHARSMALGEHADTIWARCTANVPHYRMDIMKEIRDTIRNSDKQVPDGGAGIKPSKRTLAMHVSEVSAVSELSVDDMGLPTLNFASSQMEKHSLTLDPLMADAEKLGVVPPTKLLLKQAMGIQKKPAAAKASSSHVKPKAKKPSTTVSTSVSQKLDKASLKLCGPFKDQSYITHLKPPKLVVSCSAKQTPNHYTLLKKVLEFIQQTPNCSKQAAVEKRNKLLSTNK